MSQLSYNLRGHHYVCGHFVARGYVHTWRFGNAQNQTLLYGVMPVWKMHKTRHNNDKCHTLARGGRDWDCKLGVAQPATVSAVLCFRWSQLSREQTGVCCYSFYASACFNSVGDLKGLGECSSGVCAALGSVPATHTLKYLLKLCVSVCLCVCICAAVGVPQHEAGGRRAALRSHSYCPGIQGWMEGCGVWMQACLSTQPSCQPLCT